MIKTLSTMTGSVRDVYWLRELCWWYLWTFEYVLVRGTVLTGEFAIRRDCTLANVCQWLFSWPYQVGTNPDPYFIRSHHIRSLFFCFSCKIESCSSNARSSLNSESEICCTATSNTSALHLPVVLVRSSTITTVCEAHCRSLKYSERGIATAMSKQ
jgi:hypothetical protein